MCDDDKSGPPGQWIIRGPSGGKPEAPEGVFVHCKPEPNTARAQSVVDRCSGPLFSVRRWVPSGFESYLQICPPAWKVPESRASGEDQEGRLMPVRWAEAADIKGVQINGHTHWASLRLDWHSENATAGFVFPPIEQTPTRAMIRAVADAVMSPAFAQEECLVALWEGFGTGFVDRLRRQRCARIVGMGQQRHFVLSAPLSAVMDAWVELLPDDPAEYKDVAHMSPQAIWPTSGAWFYTVPFDWASSFFAGSSALAQRLMANASVEAYPLAHDADYTSHPRSRVLREAALPRPAELAFEAKHVLDAFKVYLAETGVVLHETSMADKSTVAVQWDATPSWLKIYFVNEIDQLARSEMRHPEMWRGLTGCGTTCAGIVQAHEAPGDWGHWLSSELGPGVLLVQLQHPAECFDQVAKDYQDHLFPASSGMLDLYKRIFLFTQQKDVVCFHPLMSL